MGMDAKTAILEQKTALGIEFGSTRIKAVLIGADNAPIASGAVSYTHLDVYKRQALHGKERMERALELGQRARQELAKIKGIEVLGTEMEGTCGVWKIDLTRLVFCLLYTSYLSCWE